MSGIEIVAMIAILGAIACFLVEMVRSGFSTLALGLLLLCIFFLFAFAIPAFQT